MITLRHTVHGVVIEHDDTVPPFLVSRSVSKKDSPLIALGETVDCFHARYGRNPAFCYAGPEMEKDLASHRSTWSAWIERLEFRQHCTAAIKCGDERSAEAKAR